MNRALLCFLSPEETRGLYSDMAILKAAVLRLVWKCSHLHQGTGLIACACQEVKQGSKL